MLIAVKKIVLGVLLTLAGFCGGFILVGLGYMRLTCDRTPGTPCMEADIMGGLIVCVGACITAVLTLIGYLWYYVRRPVNSSAQEADMRNYLATVSFVSLAAVLVGSGVLVYNVCELLVPWFAIDTRQYREFVKGTGGNLDLSLPVVREALAIEHMESTKAALKASIAVALGAVTFALHFRSYRRVTQKG